MHDIDLEIPSSSRYIDIANKIYTGPNASAEYTNNRKLYEKFNDFSSICIKKKIDSDIYSRSQKGIVKALNDPSIYKYLTYATTEYYSPPKPNTYMGDSPSRYNTYPTQ